MKRILTAMTTALSLIGAPLMAETITQNSPKSVSATMDALQAAVEGAGATVFARVNHGAGAASVEMELTDAELLIFGNPRLGTPAMQADIHAGLQLPLRVLVYAGDNGTVVAYESVETLFDGLDVPLDAEFAQRMTGALAMLTGKAIAE
ncbi:DUF302 domain-containing protein [Loktanella sp. F6476L]|uniref:DUF302 domain-containing protein n=1 Tax=Loktanella sp. F6476L TaxID=2926405 RepID=UPI001FF66B26|nr:DUF302 domain-containing protein [Loktanella sp. F6476L]MCK0119406.1 DUF302 domain-containing protein [Loktanella sp. F6476L]